MICAVKWLLRKYPNALVMVAGAWMALIVIWFDIRFAHDPHRCNFFPRGLEWFGYYLRAHLTWAEPLAFGLGALMTATGLIRIVSEIETNQRSGP